MVNQRARKRSRYQHDSAMENGRNGDVVEDRVDSGKKSQHKIDNVNPNRKCIVKLLCVHSTLEIQ